MGQVLTKAAAAMKLCPFMRKEMMQQLNGTCHCATDACMAWDWVQGGPEAKPLSAYNEHTIANYRDKYGYVVLTAATKPGDPTLMILPPGAWTGQCTYAMGMVTVEHG